MRKMRGVDVVRRRYQVCNFPLAKAMNGMFMPRGGLMGRRVDEREGDMGDEGRGEGGRNTQHRHQTNLARPGIEDHHRRGGGRREKRRRCVACVVQWERRLVGACSAGAEERKYVRGGAR